MMHLCAYAIINPWTYTNTHAFTDLHTTLSRQRANPSSLSLCQFNTMRVINKPKQSSSTTASNKDKAAYTPQKTISSFLKGLLLFNCVEHSQFPPPTKKHKKKHAVGETAGSQVVIVHKYNVHNSVSVFPPAVYIQPRGQSPVPKPAPLIPPPLYFIGSAEQGDSFKMLEEGQSG